MTPKRLLWGLAGTAYLGYLGMAVTEAPTLGIAVGLALLPALRLLPEAMLLGVGMGVGWFLGLTVSAYTAIALMVTSAVLALAAGREQQTISCTATRYGAIDRLRSYVKGWNWVIGVVVGYGAGIWWVSR